MEEIFSRAVLDRVHMTSTMRTEWLGVCEECACHALGVMSNDPTISRNVDRQNVS